jgi:hypothetical protein
MGFVIAWTRGAGDTGLSLGLANERQVAAVAHQQALCALLFLYKTVLQKEFGGNALGVANLRNTLAR